MSRSRVRAWLPLAAAALFALPAPARALEECRLLRQPDIAADRIVFVYGGDLWTVARDGGVASRLTSHEGIEQFPKFSPDGRTVAFTGEYDGNLDVYTIATAGGDATRLTFHPGPDMVSEWYPDGRSILIRSQRASPLSRPSYFFRVPAGGGLEEQLPLPSGGYCSFSPDGQSLAYVSPAYDNRTWKRYQGGNSPDLWTYDFARNAAERITDWVGADEWPMWWNGTLYYNSDRGGRTANVWAYDFATKQHRQVTRFTEYDVKWPSLGGNTIVFENGGALWTLDLPNGEPKKLSVLVPDDKPATRAAYVNVAPWTTGFDLSPSAKRAVLEARGELFTVPAEHGDVRNLTNTPGARERAPAWSPDGRWIAYLSDQSGEYQIHVMGADGKTAPRQVTKLANTYPFNPRWSPDSKRIAFSDQSHSLYWCDVATGKVATVDKSEVTDITDYAWSGDSKWLAYAKTEANLFPRLYLASTDGGRPTPIGNGLQQDFSPSFDPDGRYLFFASRRRADLPTFQYEYNFGFPESDKLYAVTLRDTLPSPVAPLSDEESGDAAKADEDKEKDKADAKGAKKPAAAAAMKIDLAGIGERVVELPVDFGRYGGLTAFKDKLVYLAFGDPADEGPNTGIRVFTFEKREDKAVLSGVSGGYATSKDGGKLLYRAGEQFGIVDVAEGKKPGDGKIESGTLMATVDPPREWRQMFDEAWRLQRDFYYDPGMGGLDWNAIGARYRALLPYVAHRADLNYVLGEMQGELSTSHAYVGGGAMPNVRKVDVGLLGVDWALDPASQRYRFRKIYRERDWNQDAAAPLGEPGLGVSEGDVLIAVNGRDVKAPMNVYAAFEGTTGKQTTLTISGANGSKSRTVVVTPVASEQPLRYRAWVSENREKVARATGGRIAYIHVPNTADAGIEEFTKQYYAQSDKQGIIVDERWNGGGFIPDFFVERLKRRTLSYWSTRYGDDFRTPGNAIDGPKCILANHYAGSGGDCFPYYFRQAGLGPIIGTRTWGGLVGISRDLPLADGGSVTIPDFGFWDPATGRWEVENHGVDPDIEIENTPDSVVSGRDLQLERAIAYCLEQLQTKPPVKPKRPPYKVQPGLR